MNFRSSVNGKEVVVPVMVQPGQANGSVGLSLGFGKTFGLKEEMQVGVNAYPLYTGGNNIQYNVAIEKVGAISICLYTSTKNNCRSSRHSKSSYFKRIQYGSA